MRAATFLSDILASTGQYCLTRIDKDGKTKNIFFHTVKDLVEAAKNNPKNHNLFFACATYKDDSSRKQTNVEATRSFWIDVDAGENKPYANAGEALAAIDLFCDIVELPRPSLVTSGNGYHCYWTMDDDMTPDEWQPIAEQLKGICREKGLDADPVRTADIASVLRIPGTFNYKDQTNPKMVVIENEAVPISLADFRAKLDATGILAKLPKSKAPKREMDAVTKALMGNNAASFETIARKSLEGTGCQQIKFMLQNRSTLDYDMWTAGLSIANVCEDREIAIDVLSKGHPDYDPSEADWKAGTYGGPRTCNWFKSPINGTASRCEGCIHAISSPIQLGAYIVTTEPNEAGELEIEKVFVEEDPHEDEPVVTTTKLVIPNLPWPYSRGANGGIYKEATGPDGEPTTRIVYENDLFVTRRMKDPELGEMVVLELYLPMDGRIEFELELTALNTDKVKTVLASKGVAAIDKDMKEIIVYISKVVKELQAKYKADKSRTQFGWCDQHTRFIVGTREYSSTGTSYNPTSSATKHIIDALKPTGDLAKWKYAFNQYARKDLAHLAFAAFTGFGSPLMTFTDQKGALICLVSNSSGSGKTTAMTAAASVWGSADKLMTFKHDTVNSRIQCMGVMNSLGSYMDELTNVTPDEVSDIVYTVTMGRGRNRMKAAENALRENSTTWEQICIATSNSSMSDKLALLKATSDGENMRMLEIFVPEITIENGEEIFGLFNDNYGLAGDIYAQHIVGNIPAITKMLKDMRKKIQQDAEMPHKERFLASVAACNIVGGIIAKELGLHDIDMNVVYNWIIKFLRENRLFISKQMISKSNIIGEFINSNYGNILKLADEQTSLVPVSHVVPNKVVARFAPDTKKIYISKRELREFCVPRQIGVQEFIKTLTASGEYLGEAKKRLLSGTGLMASPVDVYIFRFNATVNEHGDLVMEDEAA